MDEWTLVTIEQNKRLSCYNVFLRSEKNLITEMFVFVKVSG